MDNAAVILALLADLYKQLANANAEIERLQVELAKQADQ